MRHFSIQSAILVFQWSNAVQALDRATTVTCNCGQKQIYFCKDGQCGKIPVIRTEKQKRRYRGVENLRAQMSSYLDMTFLLLHVHDEA
jgi:hypothetical protein